MQDCSISITNALGILQSCTKPPMCLLLIMCCHCPVLIKLLLLPLSPLATPYRNDVAWASLRLKYPTTWLFVSQLVDNENIPKVHPCHDAIFIRTTIEFSSRRPLPRSFDVFFDLRLNKRFSKQSWVWWFEMPLRSLWRHCNINGRVEGSQSDSLQPLAGR